MSSNFGGVNNNTPSGRLPTGPINFTSPLPQQQTPESQFTTDSYRMSQPQGGYRPGYYPQDPEPTRQKQGIRALVSLARSVMGLFKKPKPEPLPELRRDSIQSRLDLPTRATQSDEDYITGLYAKVLGRKPDPEGFKSHLNGLKNGTSREELLSIFLNSDEYKEKLAEALNPTAKPGPQAAPVTYPPGADALQTVKLHPEYLEVPLDRSNPETAIKQAADWVKKNRPHYFQAGDDRQLCFEMMGEVIGILRAQGFDAHRVVNHPSRPMGDGHRYGSDALVLNGQIYDVYQGMGDPDMSIPQALNVGPYEAGRLRE